ncbi:MAG: CehA/McbA family metallohydrolase [Pirellulaceae bacterium]
MRQPLLTAVLVLTTLLAVVHSGYAADITVLTEKSWEEFAPKGKEVDCIYGDFVLRNDKIVVVIAQPLPTRNANMTVRGVGGMIIDLTQRHVQNDQLSAYYAGGGKYQFHSPKKVKITSAGKEVAVPENMVVRGRSVTWSCEAEAVAGRVNATIAYSLSDDSHFITCTTTLANATDKPLSEELIDAIRADRTFSLAANPTLKLFQADDEWFRQSYGIVFDDREPVQPGGKGNLVQLQQEGMNKVTIEPGKQATVVRHLFPGQSELEVRGRAAHLRGTVRAVSLLVSDPAGPVAQAKVTVNTADGKSLGTGRTDAAGKLSFIAPSAATSVTVQGLGRPVKTMNFPADSDAEVMVAMEASGYVKGTVTDDAGKPIPCKVAFHGEQGTPDPNFGPESGDTSVKNLVYAVSGSFTQEILPGKYEVVVSYGPEYDIVVQQITVEQGKHAALTAKLKRSVNTAGWVSSDFHSHSSPSGDNTSSQFGRVQNLICEHIEFGPCTEHNRIDTYVPHLKALKAEHLMATCTGMELTGGPLPVNHQNAFPLVMRARMQDGGGPVTDQNPEVQIERLALWDNKSDKLIQMNHPNLRQILGDKDLDGKPDGGFEKMFGFVDVVEVHPPHTIFRIEKDSAGDPIRNTILNWMQMLNLGYRMSGVINTDAHYNHHGSGGFRNYILSTSDDPAKIDTMEMVHNSEKGHVVVSTGPFMEVSLTAANADRGKKAIPGDDISVMGGKADLRVRVQCPNWLDINRVQVFLNGRPEPKLNFTRRTTPDRFKNDVVKFEASLPLELKSDTHVIVATIQEEGRVGRVMGTEWGNLPPTAVSNPIFVDVDGGGFKANGDLLDIPLPLK